MAGKADIVDKVASSVDGMTKKSAAEAFDAVFDSIGRHLRKGERVQVPGFGSFSVSRRAARKGRNPATGQAITIKASKNVRFKAGKELKEGLNKPRK
jgi:DNA-binding protein HU-beta